MSRLVLGPLALAVFACATACATPPRPAILSELDAVRGGNAATEARKLVPQAGAKAEKLRNDAESAWPKGQTASSEIAAERALVAYADAATLARIVKAEQRLAAAKAEAHQAASLLQHLEADQKRAASEAADLDAQLRVAREAEPLADTNAASADRELARLSAAKTAVMQARLLCVSAKLVASSQSPALPTDPIDKTLSELESLQARLERGTKPPTPIREAISARSQCHRHLTEVRRPARMANPASENADRLFEELAQAGFAPSRDDRGIVVTLQDAFQPGALVPKAEPKLTELASLSRHYEQVALLVVSHSLRGEPSSLDRERGDAVTSKLRELGVKNVQAVAAGGRLPIVDARDLGGARRNERLEIVFVTPI